MSRAAIPLDLADTRRIIAAGEHKAIDVGVPYNIAVADAGGGLVAHVRMDGGLGSEAWISRSTKLGPREPSTCRLRTCRT
jgi:uncharacterized protein GlcG (DUF336 family)